MIPEAQRRRGKHSDQIIQFNTDVETDITDLQREFRIYPSRLFAYNEVKASGEAVYDRARAQYDEAQADAYVRIKGGEVKVTEKHAEALVLLDAKVKAAFNHMLDMKREFETFKNYVESMRAKKDMLVQLGADSRRDT